MVAVRCLRSGLGAALLAVLIAACVSSEPARLGAGAQAGAAFADVARVLRHPRCLNCHPSGDVPHVGDAGRPHPMLVQRGLGGLGLPGQRCNTCHRPENQDLVGVPGAPRWRLAPRSMGWEGLDDHALAEHLKDRARDGDRSLPQVLEHVADDPLVGWGWDPGAGRDPVPVPRQAFVAAMQAWIDAGAPSPPPGPVSTF